MKPLCSAPLCLNLQSIQVILQHHHAASPPLACLHVEGDGRAGCGGNHRKDRSDGARAGTAGTRSRRRGCRRIAAAAVAARVALGRKACHAPNRQRRLARMRDLCVGAAALTRHPHTSHDSLSTRRLRLPESQCPPRSTRSRRRRWRRHRQNPYCRLRQLRSSSTLRRLRHPST